MIKRMIRRGPGALLVVKLMAFQGLSSTVGRLSHQAIGLLAHRKGPKTRREASPYMGEGGPVKIQASWTLDIPFGRARKAC